MTILLEKVKKKSKILASGGLCVFLLTGDRWKCEMAHERWQHVAVGTFHCWSLCHTGDRVSASDGYG